MDGELYVACIYAPPTASPDLFRSQGLSGTASTKSRHLRFIGRSSKLVIDCHFAALTPHPQPLQTLFFDRELVIGQYAPTWLMEQFYYETIGQPYSAIIEAFERSMPSPEVATMRDVIERRIVKVRLHGA